MEILSKSRVIGGWILASLACLGALLTQSGCATNPATGRLQFDRMSVEEEIALGQQAMPELVEGYGGEVPDSVLRDYVTEVGSKMTPHTEAYNPDLPWEFTLLDSEVINAFALPGGKVFMSRGLMDRLSNEAQLAGVLGHEIGHVTAQHTDERISQAYLAAFGVALATGVSQQSEDSWVRQVVPLVVGAGGGAYMLKYGRGQELEADELGMRYMRRAGYDPYGQLMVMEVLNESREGPTTPEWMSTHPHPETRIENIRRLLQTKFKRTQNNPQYQLFEAEFQRIARPRLDRLRARRQHEDDSGRLAAGTNLLDHPQTWCQVCRSRSAHESH